MFTQYIQVLPENYDVVKQHNRSNAVRLGMHAADGTGMEEAVLRYQGVLFMFNLPPVKRITRLVCTCLSGTRLT